MNVYIVTYGFAPKQIMGAYSSKEKAQAVIQDSLKSSVERQINRNDEFDPENHFKESYQTIWIREQQEYCIETRIVDHN